jgi:hypothetical protein
VVEVNAGPQNRSGKKRPKAATNLPQYAAFCHWQLPPFAAICAPGSTPLNAFQHPSTLAVNALQRWETGIVTSG